jgi:DNA invertase Pin-like site-specific DNA recombinase
MANPNIRVIPATISQLSAQSAVPLHQRRVAAYARVSTDSEEQMTSYEAQVDYYTKYIKERSDWVFAGIYTDEGITATNTKKRDGFNKMVQDALAGKIDLIITKSVSRFARNTVDSLSTVRKLKENGVEIYFEKENIYTFDGKGELLITIMSSLAQEESRSISENVTWGQRKRFSDGKVTMPYKRFLGYEKGEDGNPRIIEGEAEVIRRIYGMFMEGKTPSAIAKYLTERGIKTPGGKDKWQTTTINSILTNEKYKGDALLQKTYTVDFLTKKQKINEGEIPQYYVENSHPAIIEPEEFDAVQIEIARRKSLGRPGSCQSPLSTKLICGECGGYFGSKVWGSNTQYRRTIWRCNEKYKEGQNCQTPHVTEEEIKGRFVEVVNSMIPYRKELIANCRLAQSTISDCKELDAKIAALHQEIEEVVHLSKSAIYENAHSPSNQEEWEKKNGKYIERHQKATEQLKALEMQQQERYRKKRVLDGFIKGLETMENFINEFNERLWNTIIEQVIVTTDGRLTFCFKDGTNLPG